MTKVRNVAREACFQRRAFGGSLARMKNSSSRTACELRAWKGKDAHAVSGELWGAQTVNGGMHRVEGWWARECVFKLAESAHICCETSRLRDALSVRHATPSAQALVLPHEDMDAPRPSVCRVDEDARRQRRATQEGWTSTWK